MANKPGHRRFGNIRKRPSGRYQVRYKGPDGVMRGAPHTFARKDEAERWLTLAEAQIMRQEWIAPERSKVTLKDYGDRWITQRPNLRPRTVALYRQLFRCHIEPTLGRVAVGDLTTPMVREWRAARLADGTSAIVTAKSYRLLRAILNTAVREDELIRVNPCRIPGADKEESQERPVLSVAQVFQLAEEVPERYRALILLTVFGCLRWGEVTALQRRDLDVDAGTVRIRHAYSENAQGRLALGPPKSRAGRRTVSLPRALLPVLQEHLEREAAQGPTGLVFSGPSRGAPPLRRNNFRKLVGWVAATEAVGLSGLHFHDLRHTGNTIAAQTGASLRDLMTRMGHDSPRAALIYQHATSDADRAIADAINSRLSQEAESARNDDDHL